MAQRGRPAFHHRRTLAGVALTLGLVSPLAAATIRVPEDQPTIQAGLNAAGPGDTVDVAPGTYPLPHQGTQNGFNYSLVVDKALTLRSRVLYQAVLDGTGDATVLILVRAAARIEGFVLTNASKGIQQRGSPDVTWTARNLVVRNLRLGNAAAFEINDAFAQIGTGIVSNVVVDDVDSAFVTNDARGFQVRNALVLNSRVAFSGFDHAFFDVSYTRLHGNTLREEGSWPIAYGPGVVEGDPAVIDAAADGLTLPFLPRCRGPLVDAGDPDYGFDDVQFPPSFGEARNDVGAYGGPVATLPLTEAGRQDLLRQAGCIAVDYPVEKALYVPGSWAGRIFYGQGPGQRHLGEDVNVFCLAPPTPLSPIPCRDFEKHTATSIGPGVVTAYRNDRRCPVDEEGAALDPLNDCRGYGEGRVTIEYDIASWFEGIGRPLSGPLTFVNACGEGVAASKLYVTYGHIRSRLERGDPGLGLTAGAEVTQGQVVGFVNDDGPAFVMRHGHNGDGREHLHLGVSLDVDDPSGYERPEIDERHRCAEGRGAHFAAGAEVIGQLRKLCCDADNQPPTAAARVASVQRRDRGRRALVTLSADGSADAEGDPLVYRWYSEGSLLGWGREVAHVFSCGTHEVVLQASDGTVSEAQLTVALPCPPGPRIR